MKLLLFGLVCALHFLNCLALDNGLGRTPQIGWNTSVALSIRLLCRTRPMPSSNTDWTNSAIYIYINIDDCWARSRNHSTKVVIPDNSTFPDFEGMIKYIHSKGLKLGLYSDAGTSTCARCPGSLGYEEIDADTYAKWDVDYLKYDSCYSKNESAQDRYTKMRDALNKTGRPIFLFLMQWRL